MIYKTCGRCGRHIPSGTTCPCYQQDKRKYAKPEGVKKYYHTTEWRKISLHVLAMYNYVDVYAWVAHKQMLPATTVHHIVPIKEDYSRRADISNLIPVSDASHKGIEKLYRDGRKTETQNLLRGALQRWREQHGGYDTEDA